MSEAGQGPKKWRGDPEEAFPARHPREPGGLRQDILDELADHLACALEHELEGQEDNDEDAAWSRVLARFGDPDAMARKLWWDQMRETIMREWIQTGVTFVMAVAIVAGLILIMRLVAGVGTANEAMREAMQQVAASNQALANAMAEQRAGNEALLTALSSIQGGGAEKADALTLSNIDIVIRRGTPEGPPAPEVKVKLVLEGEGSLAVDATPDSEGRVKFGPLTQGSYRFFFEDPVSGMLGFGFQSVFAGHGSEERLILAPSLTPRPIHLDFDLPKYGDDSKMLIAANLKSTWEHEGIEWKSTCTVLIGHAGTRTPVDELSGSVRERSVVQESIPAPSLESMEICQVSGDIRVENVRLVVPGNNGNWQFIEGATQSGAEIKLVSEDESGAHYAGKFPTEFATYYDNYARSEISRAKAPEANTRWIDAAVAIQPGVVIDHWSTLPESRIGELRDGLVYSARSDKAQNGTITTGHSNESFGPGTGLALALPIGTTQAVSNGEKRFIGLRGMLQKREVTITNAGRDAVTSAADNKFLGNSLDVYAIRGDWRSQTWPDWNPDAHTTGVTLPLDAAPYWRVTGDELKEAMNDGKFLIPVPDESEQSGEQPITGIFLRWQEDSESYIWTLRAQLDTAGSEYPPCFIVTEPITTTIEEPVVNP